MTENRDPETVVQNVSAYVRVADAITHSKDHGVSPGLAAMSLNDLRAHLMSDAPETDLDKELGWAYTIRSQRLIDVHRVLRTESGARNRPILNHRADELRLREAMQRDLDGVATMRFATLGKAIQSWAFDGRTDGLRATREQQAGTEATYSALGLDLRELLYDDDTERFDPASAAAFNDKVRLLDPTGGFSTIHEQMVSYYEQQVGLELAARASAEAVYTMWSSAPEFAEFNGKHVTQLSEEDLFRVDQICNDIAVDTINRCSEFTAAVNELLARDIFSAAGREPGGLE